MPLLKFRPQKPLAFISTRQRQCLSYIVWYINKNKISPTHKQINKAMGISPSVQSASGIIEPLKKKGYLATSGAGKRNLVPTDLAYDMLNDTDVSIWDFQRNAN